MFEPFSYPFFMRALLAGILASVAAGIVGTYVVVKRIASISGGLAHAAFGGVGLGYWLGFDPGLGGAGFGVASGLGLGLVHQRFRDGLDTLIAIMWAVGMALGILFISLTPGYAPDLLSFLFGSILFVPWDFVYIVAGLDLLILVLVVLLAKEFKAVAVDEEFARVVGVPVQGIFLLLLVLTSLTVVTLIRVVGVILVIALLTMPASVARHWSSTMRGTMVLAVLIASLCCTLGLWGAYWLSDLFDLNLPTGPLIILIAACAYGASLGIRGMLDRRPSRMADPPVREPYSSTASTSAD